MNQPPDSVLTLAGPGQSEIRVQRSRFLGLVRPAAGIDSARDAVAETRRRHHDSRHVCHAWRLGREEPPAEARNDDGEPSGTAGEPILAALRRAGLTDVVGIVVRWFGGVKLGTGGLARAYGEAAELALAAAPRRQVLLGRQFRLELPYTLQKTVGKLLAAQEGRVTAEEYGATVRWRIWLPHSRWADFGEMLREASAGAVLLEPDEPAD